MKSDPIITSSISWDLAGLIIIPSVIALILHWKLSKKIWTRLSHTWFSINPQYPLHHHGLFWLPVAIFGLIALWAALFSTEFNVNAFYHPGLFINAMVMPITILAIMIPFTVAIGRFHASAQKAESNRISETSMNFKHYYDHREAFVVHMSNLDSNILYGVISVTDPLVIYEILFPNSKASSFDLSQSDITYQKLKDILNTTVNRLKGLNSCYEEIIEEKKVLEHNQSSILYPIEEKVQSAFNSEMYDLEEKIESKLKTVRRAMDTQLILKGFGICVDFNKVNDIGKLLNIQNKMINSIFEALELVIRYAGQFHREGDILTPKCVSIFDSLKDNKYEQFELELYHTVQEIHAEKAVT